MAIVDISQQMLLLLHVDSTQTLNIHLQVYFIACPVMDYSYSLNKDTPPVHKLAIHIPQDRNCALCTTQQTLVHGKKRKFSLDLPKLGKSPIGQTR